MEQTLDGFERSTFTHDGLTRPVYRAGEGPCVVVLAEMPGITPKVIEFARRVIDLGCSVALPSLFGTPGRSPSVPYGLKSITKGCVAKEFRALTTGVTSPAAAWARALAVHEHERCGGPGVGVVGMCFTGNFALAAAVDPAVLVPVLSQPSLPIGPLGKSKADLHVSAEDLGALKERCEAEEDLCVIGLRFTGDLLVPRQRFEALRRELGDSFVAVEIDSSRGNPHGNPLAAHSVLTEHLVDEDGHPTREALDQVLEMFRSRLLVA